MTSLSAALLVPSAAKRHIKAERDIGKRMTGTIHFRKMNGLGNDFVVLDARKQPLALKPAQIAAIADAAGASAAIR